MSQSVLAFNATPTTSTFNFGTHTVRIIVRNGEPWFVASDVAEALGYRDAANAARNLKDHQKGTHNLSTLGGSQKVTIINESGLYKLVLRSRKPEAEEFSDWVTGEVLPSIRQTGGYGMPNQERLSLAQRMASQAAAQVSQAVFDAVMAGDADWQHSRYLLSIDGADTKARQIERSACVLPITQFHAAIEDSFTVDAETLTQLVSTCTTRLGRMAQRSQSKLIATSA